MKQGPSGGGTLRSRLLTTVPRADDAESASPARLMSCACKRGPCSARGVSRASPRITPHPWLVSSSRVRYFSQTSVDSSMASALPELSAIR
jgi:hypothetical protein